MILTSFKLITKKDSAKLDGELFLVSRAHQLAGLSRLIMVNATAKPKHDLARLLPALSKWAGATDRGGSRRVESVIFEQLINSILTG